MSSCFYTYRKRIIITRVLSHIPVTLTVQVNTTQHDGPSPHRRRRCVSPSPPFSHERAPYNLFVRPYIAMYYIYLICTEAVWFKNYVTNKSIFFVTITHLEFITVYPRLWGYRVGYRHWVCVQIVVGDRYRISADSYADQSDTFIGPISSSLI